MNIKFLRQKDYEQQITDDDLVILAGLEESTRHSGEDSAQREIESYLRQRYDVAVMLRIVTDYDNALTYIEDTRIQWIEDAYDNDANYVVGELVSFTGNIFINIQNSTGTDPTDDLFWTEIGVFEGIYVRKGTDTSAGNLPNNITFWTLGDDRDAQIKMYMIDIALYHLHPRISPRVIPDLRVNRYKQAVEWLKKVAKGDVQPDNFPVLLDADGVDQGDNITFSSNVKLNHNY